MLKLVSVVPVLNVEPEGVGEARLEMGDQLLQILAVVRPVVGQVPPLGVRDNAVRNLECLIFTLCRASQT